MPASARVKKLCAQVLAWQKRQKVLRIPKGREKDDGGRKLARRLRRVLRRRFKARGTEPWNAMLNEDDCVMVNSIPGVHIEKCGIASRQSIRTADASTKRQVDADKSSCMRGITMVWPLSQLIDRCDDRGGVRI
jgi:hypothetical protein